MRVIIWPNAAGQATLLDGPAERIQPSTIQDIAKAPSEIRRMREIAIVVSGQALHFAMDVADRLFVTEGGRSVHERDNTNGEHTESYLSVGLAFVHQPRSTSHG